ncbi:MAG TPA: hypothetical protein VGK73_08400 [Polyangiaceae bacterium]
MHFAVGVALLAIAACHDTSPAKAPQPCVEAPPSAGGGPPAPPPETVLIPPSEAREDCAHEGAFDHVFTPAPCSGPCSSFRVTPRRCEQGSWRKLEPIEPACACAPPVIPAALRSCPARSIVLTPSESGAIDGVKLTLGCEKTLLEVTCDGENDGTGTSLCDCYRDGKQQRVPGAPYQGEGIEVAYRFAELCLAAK